MTLNKQVIIYLIVFFAAIYQDFPLYNYVGEIGRSPIVLLSPFMLAYILSNKHIIVSKYVEAFIKFLLYCFLISVVFITVTYIHYETFVILEENIILKTLKMSVYPIVILITYQFFYSYLSNNFHSLNNLFSAVYLTQLFLVAFIALEIYYLGNPKAFFPLFHTLPEKYWRVRLLTPEESWTGTILVIFMFLPVFLIHYLKIKGVWRWLVYFQSAFLFFSYAFVSQSKGFLLLVLISVLPLTLAYLKRNKYLRNIFIITLIITVAVGGFLGFVLREIIIEQITTSGTFGTRFSSITASLLLFVLCPIGVGWSGFVTYFPQVLEYILESSIVDEFNLQEVRGYLSTTKALSTKTAFFDELMYGGIFFLIFFYQFFIKRYFNLNKIKNIDFYFLKIPLAFTIMAGVIYITYHVKYDVWIFLALTNVFEYKYNSNKNEDSSS
ncbi:hypothetical protein MG290_09500 [Flavobacterium sp. CBA20B-1]|uniref:hypothetical protein n=1 Tax=unclassified Flavobacterium TaxID=196869 RepID=UPI0022255633|nr:MULTISPECIES: hypothetical protein [unclassified Flavobacterium]WCM41191.1 hypothetical protein MG290_09500 [Flavobacterium sp. CBA20B-1]